MNAGLCHSGSSSLPPQACPSWGPRAGPWRREGSGATARRPGLAGPTRTERPTAARRPGWWPRAPTPAEPARRPPPAGLAFRTPSGCLQVPDRRPPRPARARTPRPEAPFSRGFQSHWPERRKPSSTCRRAEPPRAAGPPRGQPFPAAPLPTPPGTSALGQKARGERPEVTRESERERKQRPPGARCPGNRALCSRPACVTAAWA